MESRARTPEARPRRAGAPCLGVAFGLLLALAVVAGAGVDYLPTNDGPRHLFAIRAAQNLDDTSLGWGRYFDAESPITSQGFGLLFGSLERWLPWQPALRVSLALMLGLWMGGALAFVHALHPARAWLALPLAAAAFQWSLYMGFFSFYIGTALGLWILAFALGPHARGRSGHALLAGLMLVQALMHVVAAALTGLVLALLRVGQAEPGGRLRAAGATALLGLPAAGIALWLLVGGAGAASPDAPPLSAEASRTPWWALGRCFMGGPAWRAWPLVLLACLGPLLALRSPRRADRALALAGALLLPLAWALPLHLPNWHFVSVRLLPLAVCVAVAVLPVERVRGRLAQAVPLASLLFALASTGWAFAYNRDLAARSADALSGLDQPIARDGPRLPINLDPALGRPPSEHGAMPYAVPLANLGHLYALAQGGTVPHNFAVSPKLHHLRFHDDAYARYPAIPPALYDWAHQVYESADPLLRAAIVTDAARYGAFYQDVVIWGVPEDVDLLAHRGFEIDWRRGGLGLARFRGCPLRLEIDGAPPLAPDARLELGWYPLDATARRVRLRGRAERDGSRLRVELPRAPCGAVWLRILPDGRGGPGAAQAALRCRGADARARLVVPSLDASPLVRCQVESVAELAEVR